MFDDFIDIEILKLSENILRRDSEKMSALWSLLSKFDVRRFLSKLWEIIRAWENCWHCRYTVFVWCMTILWKFWEIIRECALLGLVQTVDTNILGLFSSDVWRFYRNLKIIQEYALSGFEGNVDTLSLLSKFDIRRFLSKLWEIIHECALSGNGETVDILNTLFSLDAWWFYRNYAKLSGNVPCRDMRKLLTL